MEIQETENYDFTKSLADAKKMFNSAQARIEELRYEQDSERDGKKDAESESKL